MLINKVTIKDTVTNNSLEFGFNKFGDAMDFISTAAETIDGFEQGNVTIEIKIVEE